MGQTGKAIGIIGGGQLARMLTEAALTLGFKVTVLDPNDGSPAKQAGAQQIVAQYTVQAVTELGNQVDYLTTEFEEGLTPAVLDALQHTSAIINPAPATIKQILDKFAQKTYLSDNGVVMGSFQAISDVQSAYDALDQYGGKMLIKTRRGGYDGYGNRVVSSRAKVDQALNDFVGKPVYAEAFIPFAKELAVMVGRSQDGQIVTYPVVETIQQNNICHEVLVPAAVNKTVQGQAIDLATTVAKLFEGAGMFGVEMFLAKDGQVLFNEVAPRVHNSGHYTIEACQTSQFEQHIRAITGMSLGSTDLKVPAAVMINILGQRDGPVQLKGLKAAESDPEIAVHIYGKSPTKVGRKMGHITATGDKLETVRAKARAAREALSI